jgi:hypothetical protein
VLGAVRIIAGMVSCGIHRELVAFNVLLLEHLAENELGQGRVSSRGQGCLRARQSSLPRLRLCLDVTCPIMLLRTVTGAGEQCLVFAGVLIVDGESRWDCGPITFY